MRDNYILMHKNTKCGLIAIDRDSGALSDYKPIDNSNAPFLGNADTRAMKIWWSHRAVPGSRRDMEEVIRRAGCETNQEYLAKNLALSITDTYWICPVELELSWEDVNLYNLSLSDGDKNYVAIHNGTSYDPNASLGGQMNKFWDMSGDKPALAKMAYEHYGQQSINELFATELHKQQCADIPFVQYRKGESDDNAVVSCCDAFTSESVEYVSAYEVIRSRKLKSDRSDCEHFIDICEENGINREIMQSFIDYMILTDFVISNTDRHLQNFGVLRNADTMELTGPAPLFDFGNSMFFNERAGRPLSRIELLQRPISSFHNSEEKMLKHVVNKKMIDPDKLPTPDEVNGFYYEYGIPDEKAEFISESYRNKLELLEDFRKGITISLYNEKKRK